jgi:hypothetical protein
MDAMKFAVGLLLIGVSGLAEARPHLATIRPSDYEWRLFASLQDPERDVPAARARLAKLESRTQILAAEVHALIEELRRAANSYIHEEGRLPATLSVAQSRRLEAYEGEQQRRQARFFPLLRKIRAVTEDIDRVARRVDGRGPLAVEIWRIRASVLINVDTYEDAIAEVFWLVSPNGCIDRFAQLQTSADTYFTEARARALERQDLDAYARVLASMPRALLVREGLDLDELFSRDVTWWPTLIAVR